MANRIGSTWVVYVVVLAAAYFPTALWLKYSYVEAPKPKGIAIRLERPFMDFQASKVVVAKIVPSLDALADSSEYPERSSLILYEGARPLGPAHSNHSDILGYGQGRFSHWSGSGFIFSSSDGTDPKTNGRTYWAVIPASPAE
jgi:hypothetical protein